MVINQKQIKINITSFLLVLSLFAIPALWSGSMPVAGAATLAIFFCASYLLGAAILLHVNIAGNLSVLTHTAVSIFFGSFLCSLILFLKLSPALTVVILVAVMSALVAAFRRIITFSFRLSLPEFFIFFVSLLVFYVISASFDGYYQFSADLTRHDLYWSDSHYFVSIVASLRKGTIYDAVYETGSPITYMQLLGFLFPAEIANLANVSSRFACWGLAQPFYKFMAIVLMYDLAYFFLKDKVSRRNYLFIFLSISLPVLMAPLHPGMILKGHLSSAMLFCMGYMFPNGMITFPGTLTFPFAFALFLFGALLFARIDWTDKPFSADKMCFAIVTGMLAAAKAPVFVNALAIYGSIMFIRLFRKEKALPYIPAAALCIVLSYLLIKVFTSDTHAFRNTFQYGGLADMFAQSYKLKRITLKDNVIIIGLIVFSYFAWSSIRLFGLFGLFRSRQRLLNDYLAGCLIALAAITLFTSFWHIYLLDSNGNIKSDGTFDIRQFVLAAFYLISVFSTIGALYLFFGVEMKRSAKTALVCLFSIWGLVTVISLSGFIHHNQLTEYYTPAAGQYYWYYDNENELKTGKYNDGLIAVNPNEPLYGILMSSADYGRYWVAMGENTLAGNYNHATINDYRWTLYENLINKPDTSYLIQMRREGVKYLIATLDDSSAIAGISRMYPQYLSHGSARYIYTLQQPGAGK